MFDLSDRESVGLADLSDLQRSTAGPVSVVLTSEQFKTLYDELELVGRLGLMEDDGVALDLGRVGLHLKEGSYG